jgi:phage-related tail protein
LLTPKDAAKIGIAGIIKPKPTATKKATADNIETSRGSSAKGFLFNLLFFI